MRIARLAQENPRTQGARQRTWYRRRSPQHLRSVAELVDAALEARGTRAPRAAAVLGAGACTEVPLERLARLCDAVLLVDVDVPGMLAARDELPAALRTRVDVLAADITGGVSASLEAELRAQPWADLLALSGPAGMAPLDAAAACLDRCHVPSPPSPPNLRPEGYGLVLSALVLTQLFSLPLLDVVDTLSVVAPGVVDLRDSHPRYHEAARRFRRRVALAHLALLKTLLAPEGAGVLVTDVTGYLLPQADGPHAAARRDALPVLPPDVLDLGSDVEAHFEVVGSPRRWEWLVSAPDSARPGRAYDIAGAVVRPRRD